MYKPEYTNILDGNLAKQLVEDYPLGLVTSIQGNDFSFSYLPFIIEQDNDQITLLTHIARANPQSGQLNQATVTVHFQGPNRYISPTIYKSQLQVPTWNYAVAQFKGTAEWIQQADEFDQLMVNSVNYFEQKNGTAWNYNLPEEFKEKLMKAIVGIKIKVEKIQTKFKLSQNRHDVDYQAVQDFLSLSQAPGDAEMLRYFKLSSTRN